MKAESLYIQKLTYDENTGNEIIGFFPSETNPAIVSSYTYDAKRMGGSPTITATIYSSEPLQWKKEEFVEYNGDRFFASYTPNSTKDNSSRMWKSEITFSSRRELLDNTLFFDVVVDDVDTQNKDRYRSNQTKFTFGGTIYEFVARINSSMAYCGLYRPTDEYKGYYVVVDEGYGTDEVKEVSFEDQYLTDVLQLINTTFELDYYWDGNVCHVGKVQHDLTDTPIKYGCSDALISVSKENANYKIVDMITGYGSSDNLPYYYPNDDEFGEAVFNTDNISKNNVSIDLSKLQNTFGAGNEYNKKFVLSRLITSEFSKLFVVKRNVSEKGQAYDDDPTQRGDSGELKISAKFLCIANCKIDLSNLQVNTSFDGDSGISCDFSSLRFEIVKNGIAEIKNSLDNKFVCDQDGIYEFRAYTTYQFYCGTRLPEGVDFYNGIAYLSLDGNVTISYQGDGSDYVCTEDGSIQVKTSECGILFQNTTDSMYATISLVEYISQEEGIDGGVKMSAIENTEHAASVIVTDRIWLYPSSVLLPSIYRKTGGAERFYYALNNTHKLPSGIGYYEFVNLYKKGNPHQGTVTFDDIKPTINGIVNAEGQLFGEIADVAFDKEDSDVKDSDGNYIHNYFYIKLHKFNGDFGFDLFAHALASEPAKINLIKSNGCPACSFVIHNQPSADNSKCYNCVSVDENGNLKQVSTDKNDYIFSNASDSYEDNLNQDSTQKELWIAVQKDTSTLGIVMPNASAGFKPQKGDLFVITGIKPPKVLVTAAEKRLDDALIKHMSENNTDQFNYSVKFSRIFLQENPDFASKLNENAKLSIQIHGDSDSDGNLISHEVFVSNYSVKVDNDELAEVEVELVNSLEVTKSDTKQIIDAVKGETVKSLSSMVGGSNTNNFNASITDKMYLSKLNNDTAHGTITFEKVQKFLQGLNIGDGNGTWSADGALSLFRLLTNNFDSGPYGHGAQIDEKGNIEANSIYARQFISAPKFVFNEISVTKAEQWNTNGYGTIESVDVKNRTITLHLEENDYGSLQVGDICRGLYADIDNAHGADKIEEGALDDCNFVQHKGFFSTYFYVMHIITNEKGKFVFQYRKKSQNTPDPCAYMDFAQYGSFTDEKRQSSMYFSSRGNSYIEVLDGVKTWEVQSQNRVARYGWLGGLTLVKKDGSTVRPEGNGIYVQDNIYFGGNINYLQGLSGLDDLREEAKAYDVSLSQYQSVITVDDMGNVINGLYTEDEEKTTKQYRISTAVFVRKGMDILLEEDGNNEDVTAGHYRVHAVSEDCEVMVQNSTIFVTAIRNIKDGVAGTNDDSNFDYDAMRKATDAMVTIVVELEGKTSKMVQMPIRIQHDTLPFMVCDLSNESASVAWNTKTAKYIGLPIKTKVSLMYHNEPWEISSLNISNVVGLKTSMSIDGKAKVITIDADNLTADTLAQVTKMNITVVGRYAGANYEYTRELTILKSSDTVVYELIPSADSIVVDKDGNKTVNSVSCDVYATSSDDKRYKLTALPAGMSLKYGKGENATTSVGIGTDVPVSASDDKMVTFALYDSNNNMLDKESVPVLAYGKDGKGIEYIFKLQNSAPSNPTPSGYATDPDYQRTDQEYIPYGWTDDPSGVDAVNQYEWVSKRVSTNGRWGAFSEPAEYAHFGKHAAKATSTDDIVTIPTDSNGKALVRFEESIQFQLLVDGLSCTLTSVTMDSSTLSNVSCSMSSNVATIQCEEGASLGTTAQTIVFRVSGRLSDGSGYSDYVTVKVVPNVTGADGDGYEYIYYRSSSSSASSIPTPRRQNGILTNDWQDDPMPPTVDEQYVYVAYKKGAFGSDGTFSAPKLFNRFPKSISKQETRFYTTSSLSPAPEAWKIWNDGTMSMPTDFNDSHPWLWKIVRTTYTDGTTSDVVSCEGYKAKDGIGIKSVNTYYALSDDMEQPSTSKFTHDTLSEVVISNNGNKYVWSADKVTYTNTDIGWTGIYCIGKCSDLTSVTEQYGTSSSDTNKPTSWDDAYPTDSSKGTYIWSRDKITWKDGNTTYSDAQLIGYIANDGEKGKDGVGFVAAYQRASQIPTNKPTVDSYESYTSNNILGNGWTKAAPEGVVLVAGGSVSSVSYNQNLNGDAWISGVNNDGSTWYQCPASMTNQNKKNGFCSMQVRFTTSVDEQYVTFYLKAYSEENWDFILLSQLNSATVSKDNCYSKVSGNGKTVQVRMKCGKAGSHFVTVAYSKDGSNDMNGDYVLFRMATSENYVYAAFLYRCDGEVSAEKTISWGNIYQASGDKGDKGETGVGIDSIQTYYLISSKSEGITTSSSGWSTNMVNPTSSNPYLWSYVKTTLSNGDFENSTPVIIGNFAEAGVMGEIGCIIRPSIWKSGVVYLNESSLTNKKEKYIDLVYVEDASANDGWRQYMCALTHTSASNNSPTSSDGSTYWTQLSDTGPIYAPLILAKNAVLNFTQGQQFNLVENGKIFASYRIPGSDGAALWLGGSTASSAPFSVDKNGSLKSTSGIIGGVEISEEKLGVGVADVGNKTFKGAILSSEGLFTGYKSSYFGAGVFANYDPSDSKIQMYDQKALGTNPTQSVSSPSLYIRKYSPDSVIWDNIDKYYGAALIVDVPKGVGVASLGNNVLGGLALGAVAGNSDIGSTDYLFQKNRGAVAYFTNSSACSFYLPANPHEGQVVIVIQGSTGNITFHHPGKRLVIQNTVKDSGGFYSGHQGQLNIFVYIGSMWCGTYCNG